MSQESANTPANGPANTPEKKEWPVGKGAAYTILTMLFVLNIINLLDRTLFSLAMEAIRKEFFLDDTQLGMIQSCIFLGIGLMSIPGGILLDRWGRKKTVSLMAICWSAAVGFTGMAGSFVTLLCTSLTTGCGQSAFGPSGGAWLSLVFPKRRLALANSIFQMAGVVGSTLGVIVGGVLIVQTGNWRTPFLLFGGIGLLLGIMSMFVPDIKIVNDEEAQPKRSIVSDLKSILTIPTFWRAAVAFACVTSFAKMFGVWSIPLAMRAYAVNEAQAGLMGGIAGLVAMGGPIIGGILADRLQQKYAYGRPLLGIIGCIVMAIMGVLCVMSAGNVPFWVFIIIFAINSVFSCFHLPSMQVINVEVTPKHLRGTASATQTFILFIGFSSWLATAIGFISSMLGNDLASLKIALYCLTPVPILGAITSYLACKTYPTDLAKINSQK